jgi:hypothetical protein
MNRIAHLKPPVYFSLKSHKTSLHPGCNVLPNCLTVSNYYGTHVRASFHNRKFQPQITDRNSRPKFGLGFGPGRGDLL